MQNNKVLEFPKDQSTRKRMQIRIQEQKSVLMLSIASVLVVAVFLNQWLVQGTESLSSGNNRNVASFEPAAFAKDVKWEHQLAKELSQSDVQAQIAETPTVRDELLFGFLEGKYGMKLQAGRIQSLEFIDAQAGDLPMDIADKAAFLVKYSEALGIKFSSAHAKVSDASTYNLVDGSKRIVGTAHFTLDDQGRVTSLSVQQ